jgi:hypothetical protein
MKAFLKILLILVLLSAGRALGQPIKGAAMVGFNLSKVAGDEVNGFWQFYRFGANIGAAAIIPFKKNWDVTLEVDYTQKGAFWGGGVQDDNYPWRYELRLDYVEVPLLVHYNDRDIITAGLGFSWGRLVRSTEVEDNGNLPAYQDSVPFNTDDFSIMGDLLFRLYKRMHLNIRITHSLAAIREREFRNVATGSTWENKQYNFLISLRLVYIFNEKLENQRIN